MASNEDVQIKSNENLVYKYYYPKFRFVYKAYQLLSNLEQNFLIFQPEYHGYVQLYF